MRDTFLCECFAFCCSYTKEALMQNARLLELNPEFYTAWNFRKRAVQHLLLSETDEEAHKRIVKEELDLVFIHFHCIVYFLHKIPKGLISYISIALQQLGLLSSKTRKSSLLHNIKCLGICNHASSSLSVCVFLQVYRALKVNHKSYGAWHHRKWVIALGLSPLDSEFTLLSKVLKLDARNFHSWDYRRFSLSLSLSLSPSCKRIETPTMFVEEVGLFVCASKSDDTSW
jgi:hypothetical protein